MTTESSIYLQLLFCATLWIVACVAQDLPPQDVARGSIQGSSSNHVTIRPLCHATEMHVYIEFAESSFHDWIVLGTTGLQDCLTHGDGGTKYLLRIHLKDDACGTHMVSPGIFENLVSIRTHPHLNLILENDEQVTVRCTYGPPTVNSLPIPDFPAVEARIPQPTVASPERDSSKTTPAAAGLSNGLIVLVVFMVLILAILFLLCGCCYYFFRRRNVRVTRKNKLLLAVPAGVEQDKQGMWWGTNKTVLSNDALLSHDYMVSSNSTRDPLSVSTGGEYANDTPSTGSDSNGSPTGTHGVANEVYVHESRHMIPRVHAESAAARAIQSLQSIPEENAESLRSERSIQNGIYKSWQRKIGPSGGNGGITSRPGGAPGTSGSGIMGSNPAMGQNAQVPGGTIPTHILHHQGDYPDAPLGSPGQMTQQMAAMYAQVDKKTGQSRIPQQQQQHPSRENVGPPHGRPAMSHTGVNGKPPTGAGGGVGGSRYASEMRSMSEIYTLPPPDRMIPTDGVSISTLEGIQYLRPQEVVEVDPGSLQQQYDQQISAHIHAPPLWEAMAQDRSIDEQTNMEQFIMAVEEHRGKGPRKLTDEEIDRWRTRLTNDSQLQEMIVVGKTLEDFELISHHPVYEGMFPPEKWAIIAQSLSHVTFMQKLNDIIDNTTNHNQSQHHGGQLLHHHQKTSLAGSRTPGLLHGGNNTNDKGLPPAKRIFTRDSYNRVKSDIESLSGDESLYDNQTKSATATGVMGPGMSQSDSANIMDVGGGGDRKQQQLTRDRSTTEITENYPMTASPNNHPHSSTPHSPPARGDMAENLQTAVLSTLGRQRQGILIRDRSRGDVVEMTHPTLNVYMGNVPERALQESVAPDRMPARDSFYNAMPGNSLSDLHLTSASVSAVPTGDNNFGQNGRRE